MKKFFLLSCLTSLISIPWNATAKDFSSFMYLDDQDFSKYEGEPMILIGGYESIAQNYDKGRKNYPLESIQEFLTMLECKPSDKICDLGAGTGKLTNALLTIEPKLAIIAVELSPEMGRIFAEKFSSVPLLQAPAEAIPLPDQSVDIVVIGTAFHWFANKQALAEIARILKPGGRLGLIWNVFDWQIQWVKEVRHLLDHKRAAEDMNKTHDFSGWQQVFGQQNFFEPLKHTTTHYTYHSTEQDVINRMLSSKLIEVLSSNEVDKLCKDIRFILDKYDLDSSALDIPYRVEMYWTKKL